MLGLTLFKYLKPNSGGQRMNMFLFIFTSFMIDGDILQKQQSYFSFPTELECRAVELITMGKNEPENCPVQFTPHISNKTEQIIKALDSSSDV